MRTGEQPTPGSDGCLRVASGCDPASLSLSKDEGYLLSRIDGRTTRETLRQIGALPPEAIDRCLERWLKEGVIEVVPPGGGSAPRQEEGGGKAQDEERPAAPARVLQTGSVALPEVDESLEISREVQEEVLSFAAGLERPYHAILGVPADADTRALKKAYFQLSKRLHPDRYFRKRTGAFGPLIETCFKRLLEAYELLSDPQTRAEVQKAAVAAPAAEAAPAAAARAASAPPGRRAPSALEARRRLRARVGQLSGHRRALDARKRKAKSFFESGMAAFAQQRWLEAAGSVRLAIAFDPQNQNYKEEFARVQRKAHEERAAVLLKQAQGATEMRNHAEAYELFSEAVHYRPFDAELAWRTAVLAWQVGDDLRKAKELAQQAAEIEADNALYRRTLGQIYAAAGLSANARRELEAALRLDPKDKEAKVALRAL